MSLIRIVVVSCFGLISTVAPWLSVAVAGEAAASVEGSLVANGETVNLPYVYVYAERKGFYDEADPTWTLLFVEQPIEERKLDDHIWDSAYVRVGITRTAEFGDEPELDVYSQNIRFPGEETGNISGGTYPQIELSSTGPDRFAGRLYLPEMQEFFDDTFQYDFTFCAPLSDPFGPIGDPLPAGGGEPAAAYLAWIEAIHAGDLERLKSLVSPDQAAMLESEDIQEELEFMQMMTPTDVEVAGGSSDGETAILQVTGMMDGETVEGEITLVRQDGRWVATNSAWQ